MLSPRCTGRRWWSCAAWPHPVIPLFAFLRLDKAAKKLLYYGPGVDIAHTVASQTEVGATKMTHALLHMFLQNPPPGIIYTPAPLCDTKRMSSLPPLLQVLDARKRGYPWPGQLLWVWVLSSNWGWRQESGAEDQVLDLRLKPGWVRDPWHPPLLLLLHPPPPTPQPPSYRFISSNAF